MSHDEDLVWKPAVEQAALLRDGSISARELLDVHHAHIDRVNPDLNAIVTLAPERAAADAARADQAFASGELLGPLHGLPIAHKDLAATAGIRTTNGSLVMADEVPEQDALIVERSHAAGAVLVGKTNTPEFGMGSNTFNEVFGYTVNPYDTGRSCGGSSGGAAVALAAGMVPLADGSDMGGSLRNPAAFCNIVGFRPSPGRVPAWPDALPYSHISTKGPMGRTVDDVALLLSAQAGPDPRSPIALDTEGAAFGPPIRAAEPGLRIAWAPDLGGLPMQPVMRQALAGVPDKLTAMGHHVEEASPDLTDAMEIFDTFRAWFFAYILGDFMSTPHGATMKDTAQWNINRGLNLTMDDFNRATGMQTALIARVADFFERFDVLACPVTQVQPFTIDTEWVTHVDGQEMTTYIEWMRVCTDVTVMNVPAISVPAGFTSDGLPAGLQFVGNQRDDMGVLRIAKHWEEAAGFGHTRPPGC